MRITKKLIGYLAAASIATTSVTAIAACSFIRRPEGKYTLPGVTYDGSKEIRPEEGTKTGQLAGFTFDRELYDNEEITVEITRSTNDTIHTITPTPHYKPGDTTMTVDLSVDIPEEEKYTNSIEQFGITLHFKYLGEDQGSVTVVTPDYDSCIKFYYVGPWQGNDIQLNVPEVTTAAGSKVFKLETGQVKLARALDKRPDYLEELSVDVSDKTQNVSIEKWSIGEDGVTIKLELKVSNSQDYDDIDTTYGLKFIFKFRGNVVKTVQTDDEATEEQYVVHYSRAWEPNKLTYINDEAGNGEFVTGEGEQSVSSLSGTFFLDRPLKTAKYGEKLNITLNKESITAPEGYTNIDEYLDFKYDVIDKAVTVTFTLKKFNQDSDKYRSDISFGNIVMSWSITDNGFVDPAPASGTFKPVKFTYKPAQKDNSIQVFGYETGSPQILKTHTAGTNGIYYESNTDSSKLPYKGFRFEDLLQAGSTVTLTPQPTGGDWQKAAVLATEPTFTFDDNDNPTIEYLNFGLSFDENDFDISDVTLSFSETFYFDYTITKDGHTINGSLDEYIFQLDFEGIGETSEYSVTYDKEVFEGERHGDTIIAVTGTLNKALPSTATYSISLNSDDLEFAMTEDKDPKPRYYIEGKKITMYIKIKDVDNFTHDQTFPANLNYTFPSENGGTQNIVYPTNVKYSPFTATVDAYIKARTVPINLYHEEEEWGGTSYDRIFGNAFILAKAPGENGEINDDEFIYYVVTTWNFRHQFTVWNTKYPSSTVQGKVVYDYKCGLTDERFAKDYKFNTTYGDHNYSTWHACDYRNDYVYCDPDAFEFMDTFKGEQPFVTHTDTEGGYMYGADMAVAKVDFNKFLRILDDPQRKNEPKVISYLNKLITLDNYCRTYKHINNILNAPITTGWNDYGTTEIGGFPWQRHTLYGDYIGNYEIMSRVQLEYWPYNTKSDNVLLYQSADDFSEDTYANDELWAGSKIRHGVDVYYTGITRDKEYQSNTEFGLESMFGAMYAVQLKQPILGTDGIYLLGVFRQGPELGTAQSSGGVTYYTQTSTYIDTFYYHKTNLLTPFLEPENLWQK